MSHDRTILRLARRADILRAHVRRTARVGKGERVDGDVAPCATSLASVRVSGADLRRARASALGAAVVMAALAAFGMRRATRTVVRGTTAERLPLVFATMGARDSRARPPVAPLDEGAETEEGAWQKAAAAGWQHHLGDPYDGIDEEATHP